MRLNTGLLSGRAILQNPVHVPALHQKAAIESSSFVVQNEFTNLGDLPRDVIDLVRGHLDPFECVMARSACRSMCTLCRNEVILVDGFIHDFGSLQVAFSLMYLLICKSVWGLPRTRPCCATSAACRRHPNLCSFISLDVWNLTWPQLCSCPTSSIQLRHLPRLLHAGWLKTVADRSEMALQNALGMPSGVDST